MWVSALVTSVVFVPLIAYLVYARAQRPQEDEGADASTQVSLVDRTLEVARRVHPSCTFERKDELTILAECDDGTSLQLNLDNLAAQTKGASKADRDVAIERYVAVFRPGEPDPDAETIRANLVPVVRPTSMERCPPGTEPEQCPPAYPLAGDLAVLYAVDRPDSMVYAPQQTLEGIAPDEASLRALAVGNLEARLPPVELLGDGAVRLLAAGGNFESSLLLVPGLWDDIGFEGDPLAVVLARDLVLVADSAAPKALEEIRAAVEAASSKLEVVFSTTILRRSKGTWLVHDAAGGR